MLDAALALAPQTGLDQPPGRPRRGGGRTLARARRCCCCPAAPRDLAALLSRRHDQAALAALAGVDAEGAEGARAHLARASRRGWTRPPPTARRCAAGRASWRCRPTCRWRCAWSGRAPTRSGAGPATRATDENHYSKRAILAGILVSTLAIRLNAGRRRRDRRTSPRQIDRVMAFETLEGQASTPRTSPAASPQRAGRDAATAALAPLQRAAGG